MSTTVAAYITALETGWTSDTAGKATVDAQVATILASPNAASVTVFSWVFRWSDIQPTSAASFDWVVVDYAISASVAAGRKAMLRIQAGQDAPIGAFNNRSANWLAASVTTVFFGFTSGGTGEQEYIIMAVPWDAAYLTALQAFITASGARYNGNSGVYAVQMPGGGRIGEMALGNWDLSLGPSGSGSGSGWIVAASAAYTYSASPPVPYSGLSAGVSPDSVYSDSLDVSTWETIIGFYLAAFPATPVVMDIGIPQATASPSATSLLVLAFCETQSGVWCQANSLTASPGPNYNYISQFAAATIPTGWQMAGGGNSLAVLTASFQNALLSKSRYVEVYLTDIANASLAPAFTLLSGGSVPLSVPAGPSGITAPGAGRALYQGQPGTASTLLYTAGSGRGMIVRQLLVANVTAAPSSISVGAAGWSGSLLNNVAVPANQSIQLSPDMVLSAGETIVASQGTQGACTLTVSGEAI